MIINGRSIRILRALTVASAWLAFACTHMGAAAESHAVSWEGKFEHVVEGRRLNEGEFRIHAFETDVLSDFLYKNDYQEIVGTDGTDTFVYVPGRGSNSTSAGVMGQGRISHGIFPTNANFLCQLAWLFSVPEEHVKKVLLHTRLHFYGGYMPRDLSVELSRGMLADHPITNVRWLAPGYIVNGTNRYAMTMYPKGWLLAELLVADPQAGVANPLLKIVRFTQYRTHAITDPKRLDELVLRGPNDVQALQTVDFMLEASKIGKPLANYLPNVPSALGAQIRAIDLRRNEGWLRLDAQSWLQSSGAHSQRTRRMVVTFLVVCTVSFSGLVIYLLKRQAGSIPR